MSDYYKCEHGAQMCGTCTRALKTQHEAGQSENAALRKEVETVREVSGNRLQLWMDVCKDRDKWRVLAEDLEKAMLKMRNAENPADDYEIREEALARHAAVRGEK